MKVVPPRDSSLPPLDERQAEAVSMRTPGVVLGRPGSGKTTVLVERVANLLECGVPRDEILLLAVSRQAADDLSKRLTARLGTLAPAVATFHHFAFNLVRNHHGQAGYPHPPRFLTASQLWDEMRRLLAREDASQWPRYGNRLKSRSLPALLSDLLSGAANNDLSQDEIQRLLEKHGRPDLVELGRFAGRFAAYLKERCLLDSDGAVVEARHLLEEHQDLLSTLQLRFRHVLVDQFEDATYVQTWLATALGGTRLFVAGNVSQGINSYRGGSPANLQVLIDSPWTHAIRLQGCYRPAIAEMAPERQLFALDAPRCPDGRLGDAGRGLVPLRPVARGDEAAGDKSPPYGPRGSVAHAEFRYQSEESAWIAHQIGSLIRSGVAPADICVLSRTSTDPLARDLAARLASAAIPVSSGMASTSTGPDAVVRAAVDLLRAISASPERRFGLFLRLLGSPLGGLTRAEVRALLRAAQANQLSVTDFLDSPDITAPLPEDAAVRAINLAAFFSRLEEFPRISPDELLWQLWVALPHLAHKATQEATKGHDHSSPASYRAFLDEVERIVHDSPSTMSTDIIRLYDEGHFDGVQAARPRNGNGVTLATVHQARDGEWRHLFMPNLVEGVYPLRQSPVGNLAPMLLRAGAPEPEDLRERHLAEERRTFYVALSRAIDRIYLTHSRVAFDATTELTPCRYLARLGLPAESTGLTPVHAVPVASSAELAAHFRRQLRAPDPVCQAQAVYALDELARRCPDQVSPAAWWDNLDPTDGAAPAYPTGSLYLSASRLNSYRDCPLAFKFGQHLKLEEISGDAMSLGSLLHDVLEAYHVPGSPCPRTREALEALADEKYRPEQFTRRPVAAQARRKLTELLDLYFPRYGKTDAVVAVETPFRFNLGPHVVNGRIDRIDRLPDGTLELIDYKSSSAMGHGEAETDIQLALYILAFENVPELTALGNPGRATYLYVKHIGPRADGRRSYIPSEDGRHSMLARIDRYSRGILAEVFPSRFHILDNWTDLPPEEIERIQGSGTCRNCSFKWLCPEEERGMIDA